MNIRKCTVLIVKRGSQFLVGRIPYSLEFRWSDSAYDAWSTRSREAAEDVAKLIGGDLWLFNPVVGQLREIKNKEERAINDRRANEMRDGIRGKELGNILQ